MANIIKPNIAEINTTITDSFDISDANSTDNTTINDAIGNKDDKSFSDGSLTPSILGHLKALYYHFHDSAEVYPDGAAPVTLTDQIRDDLSDLTRFRLSLMGQFTQGE